MWGISLRALMVLMNNYPSYEDSEGKKTVLDDDSLAALGLEPI